MFIHNKNFSVVPLTTHFDIKNVTKNISQSKINKKMITLNREFKNCLNLSQNRCAWVKSLSNSELKKF